MCNRVVACRTQIQPWKSVWGAIRIEIMAAFFRDGEIVKGEGKDI